MKSLIVCLSLYLLSLVMYPCHCNIITPAPSSVVEVSAYPTDDNQPLDVCSPLCACSSSDNPLVVKYPTTMFHQVEFAINRPIYVTYDEQLQDAYLATLKTPPKSFV